MIFIFNKQRNLEPEKAPVVTLILESVWVTETGELGSEGIPGAKVNELVRPLSAARACPVHFRLPSGQLTIFTTRQSRRDAGSEESYYAIGHVWTGIPLPELSTAMDMVLSILP